jgi:hypothetical protein
MRWASHRTGVAFMRFVYGAHLDDGLIVLGASVFFILMPCSGASEIFFLEVSISVVVLYVLLSLAVVLSIVMAVANGLWLHGCGCLEFTAWLWLLDWIMHADIFVSQKKTSGHGW